LNQNVNNKIRNLECLCFKIIVLKDYKKVITSHNNQCRAKSFSNLVYSSCSYFKYWHKWALLEQVIQSIQIMLNRSHHYTHSLLIHIIQSLAILT